MLQRKRPYKLHGVCAGLVRFWNTHAATPCRLGKLETLFLAKHKYDISVILTSVLYFVAWGFLALSSQKFFVLWLARANRTLVAGRYERNSRWPSSKAPMSSAFNNWRYWSPAGNCQNLCQVKVKDSLFWVVIYIHFYYFAELQGLFGSHAWAIHGPSYETRVQWSAL